MLFSLWLIVRLLTRLLVLPDADDGSKDVEILGAAAAAAGAASHGRPS